MHAYRVEVVMVYRQWRIPVVANEMAGKKLPLRLHSWIISLKIVPSPRPAELCAYVFLLAGQDRWHPPALPTPSLEGAPYPGCWVGEDGGRSVTRRGGNGLIFLVFSTSSWIGGHRCDRDPGNVAGTRNSRWLWSGKKSDCLRRAQYLQVQELCLRCPFNASALHIEFPLLLIPPLFKVNPEKPILGVVKTKLASCGFLLCTSPSGTRRTGKMRRWCRSTVYLFDNGKIIDTNPFHNIHFGFSSSSACWWRNKVSLQQ